MVKPAARHQAHGKGGVPPKYDQKLLEALGIDHVAPERIAQVLKEEDVSIEMLKMYVDSGMLAELEHLSDEDLDEDAEGSEVSKQAYDTAVSNAKEWKPWMVEQINPRRRFFEGQTYEPQDLSPVTTSRSNNKDASKTKLRRCPLGGKSKNAPKIDFADIALLSRYLTDGGRILGRRKTKVCAKKQRELTRAIKRARVINLLPYMHKPKEFMRPDNFNPYLDSPAT